jgi:hypothetical protein
MLEIYEDCTLATIGQTAYQPSTNDPNDGANDDVDDDVDDVSSIQSCTTCDESTMDSSIAGDVHDIDVGESTQGERVIEHESSFYNNPNDYDNVFIEAFTESFAAKTTPFFCPESDDEGNCVVKACPDLTLATGQIDNRHN